MQNEKLIEKLNSKSHFIRKTSLAELKRREQSDPLIVPDKKIHDVNLNIHTNSSFSPYSPTLASYMAYKSGIKLACACDYGTLSAGDEFALSCQKLGISAISGFEVTTTREGGEENLTAIYSLTDSCKQEFEVLLERFRGVCVERTKKVCEKINRKLKKYSLLVDFEKDVLSLIKGRKGACLTLKHLYMATGYKLLNKYEKGKPLADFLRVTLCLDIEEGVFNLLCDANNPFYIYDLISALRHNFNSVEGGLTPPPVKDYLDIAKKYGTAIAYEYNAPENWIKNQTESKKTLKDFSKLVDKVKSEGFNTVCISAHNLNESILVEFVNLLKEKQMLAIFTEKTEYPRDHFESLAPADTREYVENCAYALLGNEISMRINEEDGLFTQKGIEKRPDFYSRLILFAQIGKNKDQYEK